MFKFPEDETKEFIKRIVGLPGETIQIRDKMVYVNDTLLEDSTYAQRIDSGVIAGAINPRDNFGPVTVPDEAYFVMGDNRDQSLDSRFWGYVQRSKVMGNLFFIYWSWDQESASVRWDRIGQGTQYPPFFIPRSSDSSIGIFTTIVTKPWKNLHLAAWNRPRDR